tara:strand:+ start:389 stop:1543 length:1155 start_codon:yes stop_codon:yes gene_type:complete
MKYKNFEIHRISWVTAIFLVSTLLVTFIALPLYIIKTPSEAIHWPFQLSLFFFYVIATGLSITLGYHRLFSHISFKAKWPVKLFTLLFGAASFENSVLDWASDHRDHHKFVDKENDPYDISKGFFYAHMGWLIFKLRPPRRHDNVKDLEKDPLVMWQHKYVQWIAMFMSFVLPAVIGGVYGGATTALGAFLIAGVARIVIVQHSTFLINSICHTMGKRPYSTRSSARDSALVAFLTFGEGYHNFHHTFQHDYRNGVKPWQFDPTKWTIWLLSKFKLVDSLRRVPQHKIVLAELMEGQSQIEDHLSTWVSRLPESTRKLKEDTLRSIQEISEELAQYCKELQTSTKERIQVSQTSLQEWRKTVAQTLKTLEELRGQCWVPELEKA